MAGSPHPCGRKPTLAHQGKSRRYGRKPTFEWQDACIRLVGSPYSCGRKSVLLRQKFDPCRRNPQYHLGIFYINGPKGFCCDGFCTNRIPRTIWVPEAKHLPKEALLKRSTATPLIESPSIIWAPGMLRARETGSAEESPRAEEAKEARATDAESSVKYYVDIKCTRAGENRL